MLFNSLFFWICFALVFACYCVLKHKSQNRFLLIASYLFYAYWDFRFTGLLMISTCIDYFCARGISNAKTKNTRLALLYLSAVSNLGILGFFKYYNFFIESAQAGLTVLGFTPQIHTLQIILPLGISFYTFQTISYTVDVYRKEIPPAKDFFNFALYVSFFPQLVAGPIERGSVLLPQIEKPRTVSFENVISGAELALHGLFKKVIIADGLAPFVNAVFSQSAQLEGPYLLLGVYAFAFQIYGDFAGYTDIARGVARMLGFELMLNFNAPYLAVNPPEFWKRWHISLSTWLRDYLYIPLGGNRRGTLLTYRNLLLTMLLGGLWHGAQWTFVIWGLYHGVLLVIHRMLFRCRPSPRSIAGVTQEGNGRKHFKDSLKTLGMFHLTCLGWIFFRSENIEQAGIMIRRIFGWAAASVSHFSFAGFTSVCAVLACYFILSLAVKGSQTFSRFQSAAGHSMRILYAVFCSLAIIFFAHAGANQFIYFQF